MNADIVHQMALATLSGNLPFPEIVGRLLDEGVEYYRVDYVAKQMSFYSSEGSSVVCALSFENLPAVAAEFDGPALRTAILDSQSKGQEFRQFSHRAVEAGVQGYYAFLRGKRVTYLGRQGEQHVEWFPGAKPPDAYFFADSSSMPWRASTFASGVEVKDLGTANHRSMQLVRFAPGSAFPLHIHAGPEFVYLLEGEAVQEGRRLQAGWASVAATGTTDHEFHSPTGCVFLTVYSE
ncbi:MAG TPA: cupin domain-containing protein [Burkholderiaceae bacterium]|jgi:uncharacterized protein YbcV (DUF1398 family)